MQLTSIWDGWEKQTIGIFNDGKGGFCAMGYLGMRGSLPFDELIEIAERHQETLERVAGYLRATNPKFEEHVRTRPSSYQMYGRGVYLWHLIAEANNKYGITPDEFRRIDIETQREAIGAKMFEEMKQEELVCV